MKDAEMNTSVVVADWIKRIVADERKRDAVRVGEAETAARRADLVRLNGRRLVDELHAAVTRDVEAFREEFAGDLTHEIVLETTGSEGGFGVYKPASPAASLTVMPRLEAASAVCHYRFTPTTGLPPREDRIELAFSADAGGTLRMKHLGTGQVFATVDGLSEFLLGPVFTGRPR
jgi:hypothetical protein